MENSLKTLVTTRNLAKAKKPDFLRQDGHKKAKLAKNWRKPKGIQSKMRKNLRGYRTRPSVGYKSPALVRGFTRDGLVPVIVRNIAEAGTLTEKNTAIVASGLGSRKRIEIIKKLLEKSITIANIREPEKYSERVAARLAKHKQEKAGKETKKKEKKSIDEKVTKEEEKLGEKEQKEQDKKEKDKVLTKKT